MSNGAPAPFADDFSYDYYLRLLRACAGRFRLAPLRDYREPSVADGPVMFLRHDVDVCLEAAVRLAEQEAEAGFTATYMFIPTSPLYDIVSAEGVARLRHIQELGHEVAIHFDILTSGVADPNDGDALLRRIDEQSALISNVTGAPVESISFHRPLAIFLGGPDRLGGRVNAYSATLMQCYRSDSAGRWRNGNPLLELPQSAAPVAQLLTHPLWWGLRHRSPGRQLEDFFQTRVAQLAAADRDRFARLLAETVPLVSRAA
jgi:hypothetical protein